MIMVHLKKLFLNVKTTICAAIMMLVCAGGAAHANDRVSEAERLVTALITELEQTSLRDNMTDKENKQVLNQLVENYFDVDAITRFSVGRYWRVATESERSEYAKLFRFVLLNQANEQFHKLRDLEFKPTTTNTKGDKLILVGGIIHDKSGEFPDVEIFWRVVALPDMPVKIFDIEVENISMLKTQQDENTTLIRRNAGRFSALIEALQEQLNNQQTD
jgi:phospholipid transport system substrate-binding protein